MRCVARIEFVIAIQPCLHRAQVLRDTSRLRFHRAEYVRRLAAQSVGFLLRQAPKAGLSGALRVVLRQQALAPTVERTQVTTDSIQGRAL